MTIIGSRSAAWFEDRKVEYRFPASWQVDVFSHARRRALGPDAIRAALARPLGCASLRDQLRTGMRVTILCDDISRPTRTDLLLPPLLDLIEECGVAPADVQIVIASGAHGPMTSEEKGLKLGAAVTDRVSVLDHDARNNLVAAGRTELGTPLRVHRSVVECDYRIGVGGVYASTPAGFGGGAKLVLGVCGLDTIRHFHFRRQGTARGESEQSVFRADLLDAARRLDLRFMVQSTVSEDRELLSVFAGDLVAAHGAAVRDASQVFRLSSVPFDRFDVVVADAYPFDSSLVFGRKGWWPLDECAPGCERLLIAAMPKALGRHDVFPPVASPRVKLEQKYWTTRHVPPRELLSKLGARLARRSARGDVRPARKPATVLHGLATDPRLPDSDVLFTNALDAYCDGLEATLGKRDVRVGFFRASSLTYRAVNGRSATGA